MELPLLFCSHLLTFFYNYSYVLLCKLKEIPGIGVIVSFYGNYYFSLYLFLCSAFSYVSLFQELPKIKLERWVVLLPVALDYLKQNLKTFLRVHCSEDWYLALLLHLASEQWLLSPPFSWARREGFLGLAKGFLVTFFLALQGLADSLSSYPKPLLPQALPLYLSFLSSLECL